jgi:hypothetical protein
MSEQGRRASTYENARQIKSEQMRIPIKSAWQGGALPLSYTRAKWAQIIARAFASARFFASAPPGEPTTENRRLAQTPLQWSFRAVAGERCESLM